MSFLTPLFLLGLAGLAIPVIIHLIQRERRRVVEFPSLMFLRRIPYRSVRRRRIRHWALLLLRLAALALIVAAFGRPFVRRSELVAAASGARDVVLVLDRSYSMSYGDRWSRARAAARDAVNALGPADRASLVLFASGAEVVLRSTADRRLLTAAIGEAAPGPEATKYGPALKLAGSILSESSLPRREVILITDFQRRGWEQHDAARLPDGAVLTPVSVTERETANFAVTPVSFTRSTFSGQERMTVSAGVINRGGRAATNLGMTLEINGRPLQTQNVSLEANGSTSTTFAPFTLVSSGTRGTVRLGPDALARDNAFHFVISPSQPVGVLILQAVSGSRDESLYLNRALSIGDAPRFDVTVTTPEAFSAVDADRAAVVIANDVSIGRQSAERLARFIARGGGLLIVLGDRGSWPADGPDILPGSPGVLIDRAKGQTGRLGALEYGHPVFEPFRAPRSGDFSAPRFYGYRAVTAADSAQVLARFDDGSPALLERHTTRGRVLMWTSTLDLLWSDFAVKPVFLPFVHRLVRHLAAYSEPAPWLTVGQVVEPPDEPAARGATPPDRVVLSPSGRRLSLDGASSRVLELSEQGFYEIRRQGREREQPVTVASNVDLLESDLTSIDPRELVAALGGRAKAGPPSGARYTPSAEGQERAQRLWWYLLFAGVLLLAAETMLANRLSRPL